jgi:hypothetical protein
MPHTLVGPTSAEIQKFESRDERSVSLQRIVVNGHASYATALAMTVNPSAAHSIIALFGGPMVR